MAAATPIHATQPSLDRMPAELETQYALSAAPPGLRAKATVYLLDPNKGYYLAREGSSGVACAEVETTKAKATVINLIIVSFQVNALKKRFP